MQTPIIIAIMLVALTPNIPRTKWMGHSEEARWEKAKLIAQIVTEESKKRQLDPYLTTAVMLKESNGEEKIRNSGKDFGPMQVHCPSTFMRTLKIRRCHQLMSYRTGIKAGTHILEYVKKRFSKNYKWNQYPRPWRIARWFKRNSNLAHYGWVEHYNWGVKSKSMHSRGSGYSKRVLGIYKNMQEVYHRYMQEVNNGTNS